MQALDVPSLTILIISDRVESAQLSDIILKISPHSTVSIISTSNQIMQSLNGGLPDCLIIDWAVSTIDASIFIKNITEDDNFSSVYFIGLVDTESQKNIAYSCGVHDVEMWSFTKESYYKLRSVVGTLEEKSILIRENIALKARVTNAQNEQNQIVRAWSNSLYARFIDLQGYQDFIESSTKWIVEQLSLEESSPININAITLASKVYLIGRMHIPDERRYEKITFEGNAVDALMAHVPILSGTILAKSPVLEDVECILKSMYENYDGTGFPERKQYWQIPIGARILRAVTEYSTLRYSEKKSLDETLAILHKLQRKVYDPRVVALLSDYIIFHSTRSSESMNQQSLYVHELKIGMKTAKDITTNSGLKLIPRGIELTQLHIDRIQSHHILDPILGNIYIEK